MATIPRPTARGEREVDYPTSDGRPMGETDLHRQDMFDVITTLEDHFAADPDVYVTGNLLLFYERGNKRKHISPDVFVVRGVPKGPRDYYLLWDEAKGPDVVIEITSKSTRREDQTLKLALYRDLLQVGEYFQCDPTEDYLKPPLQGHRLVEGRYEPIAPVNGRLPSAVLGLHLERVGAELRLFDPILGRRLLTRAERVEQVTRDRDEAARFAQEQARFAQEQARFAQEQARFAQEQAQRADGAERRADEAKAEAARLLQELEALRRLLPKAD